MQSRVPQRSLPGPGSDELLRVLRAFADLAARSSQVLFRDEKSCQFGARLAITARTFLRWRLFRERGRRRFGVEPFTREASRLIGLFRADVGEADDWGSLGKIDDSHYTKTQPDQSRLASATHVGPC